MRKVLTVLIIATAMLQAGGNIMEPQVDPIELGLECDKGQTAINVRADGSADCVDSFYLGLGMGVREVRDFKNPMGTAKLGYTVNEFIALELAGYYSTPSQSVNALVVVNTPTVYGLRLNAGIGYGYTNISSNQAKFVGHTSLRSYQGVVGKIGAEWVIDNTWSVYADLVHQYNNLNAKLSDTYAVVGVSYRF